MDLTLDQTRATRIMLDALAHECESNPLGNLLENHLKVIAATALLKAGFTLMEGTSRAGKGKLLRLDAGHMTMTFVPRPPTGIAPGSSKAWNSPDLRVWEPCRLVVELQIRSYYGTQDTLFSDNLRDDLSRISAGTADVLLLAVDQPIYDSLRGLRTDPRGRRAMMPRIFAQVLPAAETLGTAIHDDPIRSPEGLLSSLGARLATPFGIERIVLAVSRAAPTSLDGGGKA